VLRVGDTLLVGLSSRTDLEGAAALRRAAEPLGLDVVTVVMEGGLHLKSNVTLVAPDLAVMLAGTPRVRAPLEARGVRVLEVDEPAGANVLAVGRVVVASSAAPRTAARLARERDVRIVDVSELHKGDGALTCLSLRVPPPGAWCA
jgi:dimethylargininase